MATSLKSRSLMKRLDETMQSSGFKTRDKGKVRSRSCDGLSDGPRQLFSQHRQKRNSTTTNPAVALDRRRMHLQRSSSHRQFATHSKPNSIMKTSKGLKDSPPEIRSSNMKKSNSLNELSNAEKNAQEDPPKKDSTNALNNRRRMMLQRSTSHRQFVQMGNSKPKSILRQTKYNSKSVNDLMLTNQDKKKESSEVQRSTKRNVSFEKICRWDDRSTRSDPGGGSKIHSLGVSSVVVPKNMDQMRNASWAQQDDGSAASSSIGSLSRKDLLGDFQPQRPVRRGSIGGD